MAISSEDESFISRVHMGQLLTIQKDDLLTKNSSVSGETSHNTNEPEKTSTQNIEMVKVPGGRPAHLSG